MKGKQKQQNKIVKQKEKTKKKEERKKEENILRNEEWKEGKNVCHGFNNTNLYSLAQY